MNPRRALDALPDATLLKYYVFRSASGANFHVPVETLIYLARGLSYAEIGTLWAIQMAARFVLEVPTGYLGDRIGRRNSLALSLAVYVVAAVGFAFAHSFWAFVLPNVLWAASITFASGSEQAWLYDILEERFDEGKYARVTGRGTTLAMATMGVASVLGGYIGDVNYGYAFLASGAATAVACGVVLTFPKNRQYAADDAGDESADEPAEMDDQPPAEDAADATPDETETTDEPLGDDASDPASGPLTFQSALDIARGTVLQPPIRSLVLYAGLFLAIASAINAIYVQPIATDFVAAADLGWMYAGFTAVVAAASYFTGDVEALLGVRGWFLVVTAVMVPLLVAPAAALPVLAIPVFFVMRVGQRLTRPVLYQYVNDHAGSVGRATVLSVVSMVFLVVSMPVRLAAGGLGDLVGPLGGMAALGALLLAGAVALRPWRLADPDSTESAADTG